MLDSSTSLMCVILLFGEKSRFIGFEKSHTCAAYFQPQLIFVLLAALPSFVMVHPLPLLVGYNSLSGGSNGA